MSMEALRKQVVIVGYHRSGTSLLTQYLHKAGLFVGDDLMVGSRFNKYGYYEDMEFYEINQGIFQRNSLDWPAFDGSLTSPDKSEISAAKTLSSKRDRQHSVWGFKDPRVCLLLPFWKQVLSNPRFLIVLRNPYNCMDSVKRRSTLRMAKIKAGVFKGRRKPNYGIDQLLVSDDNYLARSWLNYMTKVNDFVKSCPNDCLVIALNKDIFNLNLPNVINQRFGTELNEISLSETFDKEVFKFKPVELNIDQDLREAVDRVYASLSNMSLNKDEFSTNDYMAKQSPAASKSKNKGALSAGLKRLYALLS